MGKWIWLDNVVAGIQRWFLGVAASGRRCYLSAFLLWASLLPLWLGQNQGTGEAVELSVIGEVVPD